MKSILKDKSKLNLGIDVMLFLLMLLVAGIGLLIKYVLVPGAQRNELYGSDVELELFGLARHDWGRIHFIASLVFMALLILHILFHWKMVVCIFKRMVPNKPLRMVASWLLAFATIFFIAFPLLVKPEIVEREPLNRNQQAAKGTTEPVDRNIENNADSLHYSDHDAHAVYEINGSQTLEFIATKYGVPVSSLAADLNIPVSKAGEKLGRLKKQYSFTMDDVRECISKIKRDEDHNAH